MTERLPATASNIQRTIDAVWRMESAKLIAALTRMVRDVGIAEDLAQGRAGRGTRAVARVGSSGQPGSMAHGRREASSNRPVSASRPS
jgi:predicted RNA polymerase sigma factor